MQKTLNGVRTISDQIKAGSVIELSIRNFHTKDTLHVTEDNKIIMNTMSILNKYWQFLQPYIVEASVTDEELLKYEYRPKKLSYDLYGTIEYYYLILRINYMDSSSDFGNFKKLRLLDSTIVTFLNEVFVKEKKDVLKNMSKIKEETVE